SRERKCHAAVRRLHRAERAKLPLLPALPPAVEGRSGRFPLAELPLADLSPPSQTAHVVPPCLFESESPSTTQGLYAPWNSIMTLCSASVKSVLHSWEATS